MGGSVGESLDTVEIRTVDDVLTVRLNRPKQLNALDPTMGQDLGRVFPALVESTGARCVVLTGNGGNFMAGADLGLLERWATLTPEELMADLAATFQAAALESLPVPVVAAVDGVAFGMGLDLALACDLVIATDRAVFGLPETDVGVVPLGAATHHLPHLLGMSRASRVVLLGERFSAAQAHDWGLVAKVVAPEELEAAALDAAVRFARRSSVAIREAKQLLRAWPADTNAAVAAEREAFSRCLAGPDVNEGIAAVRERRRPDYR